MSFCNIEVLHRALAAETRRKLMCASLFRMPRSSYRDFSKYLDGLGKSLGLLERLGRGLFDYRVYIDASVSLAEVIGALQNTPAWPHVTIVRFGCPAFFSNSSHVDTFGMMARFLPMFQGGDPTLRTVNKYDAVSVTDADFDPVTLRLIVYHHTVFDKHARNVPVYTVARPWYVFRQRHARGARGREWANPIIAQFLIVRGALLPLSLMQAWLACFVSRVTRKEDVKRSAVNDGGVCTYHDVIGVLDWKVFPRYPYGADEQFIMYVVSEYVRAQSMEMAVFWKYEMSALCYYAFNAGKYLARDDERDISTLCKELRDASGLTPQQAKFIDASLYGIENKPSKNASDIERAIALAVPATQRMSKAIDAARARGVIVAHVLSRLLDGQIPNVVYSECLHLSTGSAFGRNKQCIRMIDAGAFTGRKKKTSAPCSVGRCS